MKPSPLLSVILSTYERPDHLRRSLRSLAMQRGADGKFEVVVTDDGSRDHTADVVRHFARSVDFRVTFTTHEHNGFRLARCRNEGARAAVAPYLLFSDGDCLFPPDHLQRHLAARRPGVARSGGALHFDEQTTQRIDVTTVQTSAYRAWVSPAEHCRLRWRWLKDRLYEVASHPSKPKLVGTNIGLWRGDFERVNGFDERFVGWGCEDDDLGQRLRQAGVRIMSIVGYTRVYHLWHSPDPSCPVAWRDGTNVEYLLRQDKPTRCTFGLATLQVSDTDGITGVARQGLTSADQRRAVA